MTQRCKPKGCKCHPESPFLWYLNPRPSIFSDMASYRRSQGATTGVEAQRAKGLEPGTLTPFSKKSAEQTKAAREFFTYSRASLNVFRKDKDNE